jgi:hypothetical protein
MSSDRTVLPASLNLGVSTPSGAAVYKRLAKQLPINPVSAYGPTSQIRIALDTGSPNVFINTKENFLGGTLTITNPNPYIDFVNLGPAGIASFIDKIEILSNGQPVETLQRYNSFIHTMAILKGDHVKPYEMYISRKSNEMLETIGSNFIINQFKWPMIDRMGCIMQSHNLQSESTSGLGIKSNNQKFVQTRLNFRDGGVTDVGAYLSYNFGTNVRTQNSAGAAVKSGDSNLTINDIFSSALVAPYTTYQPNLISVGNAYLANLINSEPLNPSLWPNSIPQTDAYGKQMLFKDIQKRPQDINLSLANVKNIPIGCKSALVPQPYVCLPLQLAVIDDTFNMNPGGYYQGQLGGYVGGTQLVRGVGGYLDATPAYYTNPNTPIQTTTNVVAPIPGVFSIDFAIDIMSAILGPQMEQMIPTFLLDLFSIQITLADQYTPFTVSMDPCRIIPGTYRHFMINKNYSSNPNYSFQGGITNVNNAMPMFNLSSFNMGSAVTFNNTNNVYSNSILAASTLFINGVLQPAVAQAGGNTAQALVPGSLVQFINGGAGIATTTGTTAGNANLTFPLAITTNYQANGNVTLPTTPLNGIYANLSNRGSNAIDTSIVSPLAGLPAGYNFNVMGGTYVQTAADWISVSGWAADLAAHNQFFNQFSKLPQYSFSYLQLPYTQNSSRFNNQLPSTQYMGPDMTLTMKENNLRGDTAPTSLTLYTSSDVTVVGPSTVLQMGQYFNNCYGTYLPQSVPQAFRCLFNSSGSAAISAGNPGQISTYQDSTVFPYQDLRPTWCLSNVFYQSTQYVLPQDVTVEILESALQGALNFTSLTYLLYPDIQIQPSASQNIKIPANCSSATLAIPIFKNNYMTTSDAIKLLTPSFGSVCPFTAITARPPDASVNIIGCGTGSFDIISLNTASNQNSVQSILNNATNQTNLSKAYSIQWQIAQEYLPIQPSVNIRDMITQTELAMHGLMNDNYNAPLGTDITSSFFNSTSASGLNNSFGNISAGQFYPYQNNGFTTCTVSPYWLSDQTAVDQSLLGLHPTQSINGTIYQIKGETLPIFEVPEPRFYYCLGMEDWYNQNTGYVISGRYLGNNNFTLLLQGADQFTVTTDINKINSTITYTLDVIVVINFRILIENGGIIRTFT